MKAIIIITLAALTITSCIRIKSSHSKVVQVTSGADINQPIDSKNALQFINNYVENCNKMKNAIGIIEWVNSNQLTTSEFKEELKSIINKAKQKDPELGLGFDPIFDAQDYPDKGFEVATIDSASNYITLKGINWKKFQLTMKLKYANNQWLVDGCGIINIPKSKRAVR
ncbi:DUF3828 domain-containing protein [Prolixibacteraceae bacterium JC049]|nr:DUF3828 domain-containing protein [Prolixibacteraceae bacterium JC049]